MTERLILGSENVLALLARHLHILSRILVQYNIIHQGIKEASSFRHIFYLELLLNINRQDRNPV